MVDWLSNFFIPIIKLTFLGGILIGISFVVGKAIYKGWTRQWKFIFKFKLLKNPYPNDTVQWCYNYIENGIGWYDAKRILTIKMFSSSDINETLYIYDQILNEMKLKGGRKNVREFKRDGSQTQTAEGRFPKVQRGES